MGLWLPGLKEHNSLQARRVLEPIRFAHNSQPPCKETQMRPQIQSS